MTNHLKYSYTLLQNSTSNYGIALFRQCSFSRLLGVKYKSLKFTFAIILSIALFHYYYEYLAIDEEEIIGNIHKNNLKAVQLLTGRFSTNDWSNAIARLGEYPFQNCPEKRCYAFKPFYFRQKPFETSDAVIVHVPNLLYMPSKKSYKRNPHQLWVFFTMESQRRSFCSSHYRVEDLDDWFNITATFKLASTFLYDYKSEFRSLKDLNENPQYLKAFINEIKDSPISSEHFRKEIEKKPLEGSPAFWFVSHCETPSKREEFTKDLEKYIEVDIFGECGSEFKNSRMDPCKGIKDWSISAECNVNLFNSYKFYLAFENSLCDEYVTEKYWKLYNLDKFFKVNLVPIVRGPSTAHYEKISLKKSFINANDFKTAKSLADYLNYLNENTTAYLEYFEWKLDLYKKFEEIVANKQTSQVEANYKQRSSDIFCEVCSKLHDKEYLNNNNGKIKISEYFNPAKDCWDSPESPFLDKIIRFLGYCI